MNAFTGQRIEVDRQRANESFTFTCLHFGDVAFVKNNTAEDLFVERHHVPREFLRAECCFFPDDQLARANAHRKRLL